LARPVTIQDETILDAAREVFLERGALATTAEVAARAGVSEGTLFNRFRSKEELFRACMSRGHVHAEWARRLPARVGKGRMPDVLADTASEILAFFRELVPVLMMEAGTPAFSPASLPAKGSHPAAEHIRRLADYLEAEMSLGRIAKQDAEVLARTLTGTLFSFAFLELQTTAETERPDAARKFLEAFIDLLWAGIAPRATPRARPASKKAS
jgi:AcrR family transcriptional regulator